MDTSALPPPTRRQERTAGESPAPPPPATRVHLPYRRPLPARRSDPVRAASTTPSPGNQRRIAVFSPGGRDSLRLAPPADHRPAPRYAKGIVSVAGLYPAR